MFFCLFSVCKFVDLLGELSSSEQLCRTIDDLLSVLLRVVLNILELDVVSTTDDEHDCLTESAFLSRPSKGTQRAQSMQRAAHTAPHTQRTAQHEAEAGTHEFEDFGSR